MADDLKRNWGAEATAIAAGESKRIPQREHLVALAQHAEQTIHHSLQLMSILLVIMLDNSVKRLPIPGRLLQNIKDQRYSLNVRRVLMDDNVTPVPDGSLVLEVVLPPAPTPQGSVN